MRSSTVALLRSKASSMRCGMDASVGDELLERDAGGLAAHGVERGQQHAAGRVVHENVDARHLLEGSDVASLTADDPTLHVLGGKVDRDDHRRGGLLGGQPLHRRDHDGRRLLLGGDAGVLLDVVGDRGCPEPSVVLGAFHDPGLRLVARESCDAFQLADDVVVRLVDLQRTERAPPPPERRRARPSRRSRLRSRSLALLAPRPASRDGRQLRVRRGCRHGRSARGGRAPPGTASPP